MFPAASIAFYCTVGTLFLFALLFDYKYIKKVFWVQYNALLKQSTVNTEFNYQNESYTRWVSSFCAYFFFLSISPFFRSRDHEFKRMANLKREKPTLTQSDKNVFKVRKFGLKKESCLSCWVTGLTTPMGYVCKMLSFVFVSKVTAKWRFFALEVPSALSFTCLLLPD